MNEDNTARQALREALEFYANEQSYLADGSATGWAPIIVDKGAKARQALQPEDQTR